MLPSPSVGLVRDTFGLVASALAWTLLEFRAGSMISSAVATGAGQDVGPPGDGGWGHSNGADLFGAGRRNHGS